MRRSRQWICRIQVFSKLVESALESVVVPFLGRGPVDAVTGLCFFSDCRYSKKKGLFLVRNPRFLRVCFLAGGCCWALVILGPKLALPCSAAGTHPLGGTLKKAKNHDHKLGFPTGCDCLMLAKSPRSARKYCNTGATAQEREQAQRLIHGCGSNITVNLICYRVTSTRD